MKFAILLTLALFISSSIAFPVLAMAEDTYLGFFATEASCSKYANSHGYPYYSSEYATNTYGESGYKCWGSK